MLALPRLPLPLRLVLAHSSRPNMASRARATASRRRLATSFPGIFAKISSTGVNFGGVSKGGGRKVEAEDCSGGVTAGGIGDGEAGNIKLC